MVPHQSVLESGSEAALLFCHPLLFMVDAFDLLFSSSVPWPVINRSFPSRLLPVKRTFFFLPLLHVVEGSDLGSST